MSHDGDTENRMDTCSKSAGVSAEQKDFNDDSTTKETCLYIVLKNLQLVYRNY